MAAYIVFQREKTTDQAELDLYKQKVVASREGHPIHALARYGKHEVMEGPPVEGVVILEFPTFEAAKAWYQSPLYQAARDHRFKGAEYRVVIVEGL